MSGWEEEPGHPSIVSSGEDLEVKKTSLDFGLAQDLLSLFLSL